MTLPVETGSIAIWNYEVTRRLARSCEVIVYAKRDRGQKKVEWDQRVQYRRFPITQDLWCQRVARRLPMGFVKRVGEFHSVWYCLGFILRVSIDLRKQRCDVIHVHNFSQFVPVIRAFNRTSKIVLHMHCEWLTEIKRETVSRRLRKVDRLVGCSSYVAETIRQGFPEYGNVCRAIQNGVDIGHFRPKDAVARSEENGEKTILFVGRVSPEKGVHVLLDAFQLVLERYPQTWLQIAGPLGAAPREFVVANSHDPKVVELDRFYEGDYVAGLKDSLPPTVAARVSFTGLLHYLEMVEHYRGADILVCPSVWNEPFGLPVVEAMACGIPVVGTRSGGIQEIVKNEETGLLVERGSVRELADAVLSLLGDASRRESMGKAGRARAIELFSWDRVARELDELYGSLAEVTL